MMGERTGRIRSCLRGLRWAGIKEFLFELAITNDLEFKVLDRDKGWLRETVYFQADGKESDLRRFKDQFEKSVAAYNKS